MGTRHCRRVNWAVLAAMAIALLNVSCQEEDTVDMETLLADPSWANRKAAFWVKDKQVYTVNDAARELAPDLPAAPETITFEQVEAVAK